MIVGAAGTRELRSGVTFTSPRLRREVGARSATGEGELPRSLLLRDAPHPNPVPAGGERGHTERAAAFTFPNE
jgi:hypothetical protein